MGTTLAIEGLQSGQGTEREQVSGGTGLLGEPTEREEHPAANTQSPA